jgi:hypothetical protein
VARTLSEILNSPAVTKAVAPYIEAPPPANSQADIDARLARLIRNNPVVNAFNQAVRNGMGRQEAMERCIVLLGERLEALEKDAAERLLRSAAAAADGPGFRLDPTPYQKLVAPKPGPQYVSHSGEYLAPGSYPPMPEAVRNLIENSKPGTITNLKVKVFPPDEEPVTVPLPSEASAQQWYAVEKVRKWKGHNFATTIPDGAKIEPPAVLPDDLPAEAAAALEAVPDPAPPARNPFYTSEWP